MSPMYFFELFLGGLTRGSIYALIALGYTMVYGIIQLINFAHGEIYMIGAMTALIVATVLGMWGWNTAVIVITGVLCLPLSIPVPMALPLKKSLTNRYEMHHDCPH